MFHKTPTEVAEWTEFPTQVASHNHPTDRTFNPDNFRFNNDLVLSNEESVGIALNANVYDFLNRLMPGRFGMHAEAKVIGKPDRVYFRSLADIRMLVEIKTIWALSCDNLVEKYNEDMDLVANVGIIVNPEKRVVFSWQTMLKTSTLDDLRKEISELYPQYAHDEYLQIFVYSGQSKPERIGDDDDLCRILRVARTSIRPRLTIPLETPSKSFRDWTFKEVCEDCEYSGKEMLYWYLQSLTIYTSTTVTPIQ
ncbi:hypothetical protein BGX27_005161 [Mortierella sp. AM989]|nr:hypothetical protein BGX27_005161 [Mortierella sp. AM989]